MGRQAEADSGWPSEVAGWQAGRVRLDQPAPRKVAIVRALPGLGDMLCIIPALRSLRAALPEASITLIGLPWARVFVRRFDRYFDDFIEFPGFPGIFERPFNAQAVHEFFRVHAASDIDLTVQMHGSGLISNTFTSLLGARRAAGFYLPGLYCPDDERFLPYPEQEPEVWRHLRLMQFLGAPFTGEHLEWPVTDTDRAELEAIPELTACEPGTYVCVHAGASEPSRRWAPDRFAAVADSLAERGLEVVLTGTQAEAAVVAEVSRAMRAPHVDAAGRTSLGAMGALLAGARALVTNDTGTSHLASALAVPSVVVFTASDPRRWGPLDRAKHRRVGRGMVEHHPCGHAADTQALCLKDGCTLPARLGTRSSGMPSIEAVIAAVEDLLAQP